MINALIDFQAFEQHQALKNTFRTLHQDGYVAKVAKAQAWDTACDQLVYDVVRDYALPQPLVEYSLKSVAYGVGKLTSVTLPEEDTASPPSPQSTNGLDPELSLSYMDLIDDQRLSKRHHDKAIEYLQSIIETKTDWKKEMKIDVKIHPIYKIYGNAANLQLALEITGPYPTEQTIDFVLYDHRGNIIGKSLAFFDEYSKDRRGFRVCETDSVNEEQYGSIANIARIVVY